MIKKILISSIIFFLSLSCFSQSKAKFYTNKGDFTIYLEDTLMPITAGNFISLVKQKYYDGVIFHRVIDNFMIQGGNGATKPSIQDEFHASLSNVMGTISMANRDTLNSGTTQFFINLKNNTGLDNDKFPFTSQHPVFGHVVEGFSVVQTIGKVSTSGRPLDKPLTDIVMDSVRLLIPDPPSSIAGPAHQKLTISVYPNPAQNVLSIYSNSQFPIAMEIIDVTGKVVLEGQLTENRSNQIDISNLNNGLYILRANYGDAYVTKRIMVRH